MQAWLDIHILTFMRERLVQSDQEMITVTGQHIVIDLGRMGALSERLSDRGPLQYYLYEDHQDDLPYPVTYLDLTSYWESEEGRLPIISSTISLAPTSLENSRGTWPYKPLEEIEASLNKISIGPISRLEHDPLSIYIALDNDYTIRISLGATHEEMDVSIVLVQSKEIEHATHKKISNGEMDDIEPREALALVASLIANSIDILRNIYGDPPRFSKRYSLAIRPQSERLARDQDTVHSLATVGQQVLALEARPERIAVEQPPADDTVTFDKLGGLHGLKEELRALGDVFIDPETASNYGIAPSPFIIYGPTGTGKRSLVEAFAEYCGAKLRIVDSTEVLSKWQGEPAKNFEAILEEAYETEGERVIVFFDRIDTLLSNETRRESANYRQLILTFESHVSHELPKHPHVLIAGTSGLQKIDLDPDVVGSGMFESFYTTLPNEVDRRDIWLSLIASRRNELARATSGVNSFNPIPEVGTFDYISLAYETEGMSGLDIKAAISAALKQCYHRHRATGETQIVTQELLIHAIRNLRLG